MSDNDFGTLKGLFVGMAVGFVAGAVTAMFLTTKTGEELRADIKKITTDVKAKAEEKASRIKNLSNGMTFTAKPYPNFMAELISAGGLIEYTKKRLGSRRA